MHSHLSILSQRNARRTKILFAIRRICWICPFGLWDRKHLRCPEVPKTLESFIRSANVTRKANKVLPETNSAKLIFDEEITDKYISKYITMIVKL